MLFERLRNKPDVPVTEENLYADDINRDHLSLFHADILFKGQEKKCLIEAPSEEAAKRFLVRRLRNISIIQVNGVGFTTTESGWVNPAYRSPVLQDKVENDILPALMDFYNAKKSEKPTEERNILVNARQINKAANGISDGSLDDFFHDQVGTQVVSMRKVSGSEIAERISDQTIYFRQCRLDKGNFDIICKETLKNEPVSFEFYRYAGLPVTRSDIDRRRGVYRSHHY